MTRLIDSHLRFRGFSYHSGSACDCEDYFKRSFVRGTVVIEYSKCYNGKKSKSCPYEYHFSVKGGIIETVKLKTAREFDEWLKSHELIDEGLAVNQR